MTQSQLMIFFEHVPRVALDYNSKSSHFPFIELIIEIWRVLKTKGKIYADTSAFTNEKGLRDSTHANIVTAKTHRYFTKPQLLGDMYGFDGEFQVIRQSWVHPRGEYEPAHPSLLRMLRNLSEKLTGEQSHLLWEFSAIKPESER